MATDGLALSPSWPWVTASEATRAQTIDPSISLGFLLLIECL